MVDPAADAQYYWLAADGTRLSGSERELRAALSNGALRSETLVWRPGWAEWLPAHRVAELAAAIAQVALPPSSFGTLGPARRTAVPRRPSSGPPPPPQRNRKPLPAPSEQKGGASVTATLRPPGAVPPPARGAPAPALDSSARARPASVPVAAVPVAAVPVAAVPVASVPVASAPVAAAPVAAAPVAAAPVTAVPVTAVPVTAVPVTAPEAEVDTPLPTVLPPVMNRALLPDVQPTPSVQPPSESTSEVVPQFPAEASRPPVATLPGARAAPKSSRNGEHTGRSSEPRPVLKLGGIELDSRTLVPALSALSGVLLLSLLGLTLSRSQSKNSTPEVRLGASGAPSPSAPPAVLGCRVALPAARIAPNVERSVPPYAAKLDNTGELVVGLAESKSKGLGLRIDPNTLDVSPVFEEEGKDLVRGVVPLTRSGSLTFFVDRDDHALRSAHTIDEVPPFTLGVSDAGFSRVVAGSASLVWPLEPNTKITEPRSAQLANYGYGVTFRRGGQAGAIMLGFVANDGEKKSELAEVPGAPKLVGTPVIAGSSGGALLAFAGRDAEGATWKLFVSLTKPGAPPSPARELLSGSGGGAISPTLAALSGDRWLVQWTEGSSAQYHVRVQSFAADLSAIGQSVAVSPKGANAGQGALAPVAGGAATLFILTTAGHDELWGAMLACQ